MKVNTLLKVSALVLGLAVSFNTLAEPAKFTTRNYTPYYSNAQIKNMMSPFATPPGSAESPTIKALPWNAVKMICKGQTVCAAKIFMKTNTPNPVFVAEGSIVVATGEITPKEAEFNGFRLTSPEPGVIEIREIAPADEAQ